jgi:hypothetical protein
MNRKTTLITGLFALTVAAALPAADPVNLRKSVAMLQAGYQTGTSIGTGWIYQNFDNPSRKTTLILTASHCLDRTDTYAVVFLSEDGEERRFEKEEVRLVFDDAYNDIAVLSLPGEHVFDASFKISVLRPRDGDIVQTSGYPEAGYAFEPNGAVTNGRIRLDLSNPFRTLDFIRIFSGITHGSSGGPLMKRDDKTDIGFTVIGVTTMVSPDAKSGFAVPVPRILPALIRAMAKTFPDWEQEGYNEAANNTMAAAEKLPQTLSGCFSDADDLDWFTVHLSEAGEWYIHSRSQDPLEISLYDEAGNLLDSKLGSDPAFRVEPEKETDVFISVKAGQREYFQTYTLSSAFVRQDPYETDSAENPVTAGNGVWLERSLYEEDEDWIAVTALGDSTRIECNVPFQIIGPDKNIRDPREIIANETYLIRILKSEVPLEYRFRSSFCRGEIEPNNSQDEAQLLEAGLPVDGMVNGNDHDWLKAPSSGGALSLTIEGRVFFDLYDSRGKILSGSSDGVKKIDRLTPAGDFLYINIRPAGIFRENYLVGFSAYSQGAALK